METFEITYKVTVSEDEQIDEKIEGICLEQSVELPRSVLTNEVETKVVGEPVSNQPAGDGLYDVAIRWPFKNTGGDISQFLNILYGNISLQEGIRITGASWERLNGRLFQGPAFGIPGMRDLAGIPSRALSATALKPLGSTPGEIADLCYRFAAGGIDIIKDDHGITNQGYAPYRERVRACVEAIGKAAEETGKKSLYFTHITALAADSIQRYEEAAELGADGVLICPHIAGVETMHRLARIDLSLPVIAHPAFSGGLTTHKQQGLTPDFLYGELWRALGADFVIYPNTGGRFSFSVEECKAINRAARDESLPFKSSFPMPGGGIDRSTVPKWLETYGTDTVFLLGSSLYEHPDGIRNAAEELSELLK